MPSALAAEQLADVDRGLAKAAAIPYREGYVQGSATWNQYDGARARLEAVLHPWQDWSVYGAGTLGREGPGLEAGARYTFRW